MGVKITKYGKSLSRKRGRKRTKLPTRKQAMSYRHRSVLNTPICPDGKRLINGICTDDSGIGFNGNNLNNIPSNESLDSNNNISSTISPITDIYQEVEILTNLLSQHVPYWFEQKTLSKKTLILIIESSRNIYIDSSNINKWINMIELSNQQGPDNGEIILQNLVTQTRRYYEPILSQIPNEEYQTRSFIWMFLIIIGAIYYMKNRER